MRFVLQNIAHVPIFTYLLPIFITLKGMTDCLPAWIRESASFLVENQMHDTTCRNACFFQVPNYLDSVQGVTIIIFHFSSLVVNHVIFWDSEHTHLLRKLCWIVKQIVFVECHCRIATSYVQACLIEYHWCITSSPGIHGSSKTRRVVQEVVLLGKTNHLTFNDLNFWPG